MGRPDLPLEGVFLAAVLACGPRAKLSTEINGTPARVAATVLAAMSGPPYYE